MVSFVLLLRLVALSAAVVSSGAVQHHDNSTLGNGIPSASTLPVPESLLLAFTETTLAFRPEASLGFFPLTLQPGQLAGGAGGGDSGKKKTPPVLLPQMNLFVTLS